MREKVFATSFFYYGTDDRTRNTITAKVVTRDEVDGDCLIRAVKSTEQRYPYLKLKTGRNINRIWLEENDRPFVAVKGKGSRGPVLGSEESNYHLIAFGWDENNIYLYAFHGLLDGMGVSRVLKTLVYYYVQERYGVTIDSKGIYTLDDETDPDEYKDFFPVKRIKGGKPLMRVPRFFGALKVRKAMKKIGKDSSWDPHVYHIHIPRKSLTDAMGRVDGSPSPYIGILMARAIESVHGKTRRPVTIGIPINFRPAVKGMKSVKCSVYTLHVIYDERVKRLPIDKQCTAVRGRVFLQSDPDSVYSELNFQRKILNLHNCIPFRVLKRLGARIIMRINMGDETFGVSYTGQSNFGGAEKYIERVDALVDLCSEEIMLEVCVVGDIYSITFMQAFKDSVYVDAFMDQLRGENIEAEIVTTEPLDTPMVSI